MAKTDTIARPSARPAAEALAITYRPIGDLIPYVKRQKNGAADAEAICEAVTRPNMRFVPVKTEAQQSVLLLHRSRDPLRSQRTMMLNAIRAHLAEFGIIAAQGPRKVVERRTELRNEKAAAVPAIARIGLLAMAAQLESLATAIRDIERQLLAWHRQNAASQRLETIPGIGIITATALADSVPDPSVFKSGRQFTAFLGLVPRQNSSGGKARRWATGTCGACWLSVRSP
jgi:transposase